MTPIDPLERRLPDALADLAAARTPDYLVDLLGQTARTRQRPAWATPGRWYPMTGFASRPALAAIAAILVVLVGGGILLSRQTPSGVGGPPASPSASPAPSPLASPSPSTELLSSSALDRSLKAGAYRVAEPFVTPFSITFSSEWTFKSYAPGDAQFVKTQTNDGAAWVIVDVVDKVFGDPCHTDGGAVYPRATSTVDGIVAALTQMTGYHIVTPPTDVVVGGYPGRKLVVKNDIDTATAGCTGGPMLPMWTIKGGGQSGTNGGATEQLWVIDVGGTLVIIDGETFPTTPTAQQSEVGQIVQTLSFK